MDVNSSLLAGMLFGALSVYGLKRSLDGFLTEAPSKNGAAWSAMAGLRMALLAGITYLFVQGAGAHPLHLGAGLLIAYTAFKLGLAIRERTARACPRRR